MYFFGRLTDEDHVERTSSMPAPVSASVLLHVSDHCRVVVVTRAKDEPWLALLGSRAGRLIRARRVPASGTEADLLVCDADWLPPPWHHGSPIVVAKAFTREEEAALIRNGACACVAKDDLLLFEAVLERELQRRRGARDEAVQKAAASELIGGEASHWMFRSLIENGSDVIWLIDPQGVLRYNSPSTERVLGYGQGELSNKAFLPFIHEEDRVVAEMFFQQQIATPCKQSDIDLRVLHKDGSIRWFSIVASNIIREGRVVSVISNARDITDRRLLEAQLEQANRLTSLGRLAATVAHEFNNVLMGIQPFADLMQLPNVAPAMIAKGATHIAASVARGKRVTLDILRFTRPAQPSLSVVDLHAWWDRLSVEMQAMTGNNIAFVSDFADEELTVLADAAQLSQVFSNLITNARDAMPDGGTLTVRARRPSPGQSYPFGVIIGPENCAHLSVEDTGVGMPEEVRRHVFDPLFTAKQRGGTGLGLAVAHQVVSKHDGAIFVESEPGRGSTFHVFLPLAAATRAAAEEESEETAVRARRLLIVEDEQVIATGLQEMLRTRGIEVETVTRGEDALDAARRLRPDVAIVDMRLPGIDGAEVGRLLRAERPDLTLLFVSGDAGELPSAEDAAFLRKPFTLDALFKTIRRLENKGASGEPQSPGH
ncbi:MAG TPA: ATP-binding protein [Thermoanaerobaculia bacterium]|jgi:PAS domain S-box-containing protein